MFYQYKVNIMNTTIFEKIKLLPPEKQQEFENYAEYLLQKHEQQLPTDTESLAERRSRLAGRLKGQIWMAEDFNETPEDFKDYI